MILNIIQVIFIFTDRSIVAGAYIMIINFYITPIGVLFATIWTSSQVWLQQQGIDGTAPVNAQISVDRFRATLISSNNENEAYALNERNYGKD